MYPAFVRGTYLHEMLQLATLEAKAIQISAREGMGGGMAGMGGGGERGVEGERCMVAL